MCQALLAAPICRHHCRTPARPQHFAMDDEFKLQLVPVQGLAKAVTAQSVIRVYDRVDMERDIDLRRTNAVISQAFGLPHEMPFCALAPKPEQTCDDDRYDKVRCPAVSSRRDLPGRCCHLAWVGIHHRLTDAVSHRLLLRSNSSKTSRTIRSACLGKPSIQTTQPASPGTRCSSVLPTGWCSSSPAHRLLLILWQAGSTGTPKGRHPKMPCHILRCDAMSCYSISLPMPFT